MVSPDIRALVGRDRELRETLELAGRSRTERAAFLTVLDGQPGVGKTALLTAALEELSAVGWLAFRARCFAGQELSPSVALARLIYSGLEHLDRNDLARYIGGLEEDLVPLGPEIGRVIGARSSPDPDRETDDSLTAQAVIRLVQGLLLDFPVILAFDDAQWVDAATSRTISALMAALPASPLHVIATVRSGSPQAFPMVSSRATVAVEPLGEEPSKAIIRDRLPEIPEEAERTILAQARGIPFFLCSMCDELASLPRITPEATQRSAQAVLRRQVDALPEQSRELLRICSLLRPPIEYRFVRALHESEPEAIDRLSRLVGRFLVTEGRAIQFTHDLVAQSVRETIAVPEPLHRRILGVLEHLGAESIEDLDRLAYHAHACGERDLEFGALVLLGRRALSASVWDVAASAFRRAITIRRPTSEEHLRFYNEYGMALRAAGLLMEAQEVLEAGIRDGREKGLRRGFGALAAAIVSTAAGSGRESLAKEMASSFRGLLSDRTDYLELLSSTVLLNAVYGDQKNYEKDSAELVEAGSALSDLAKTFFLIAQGAFESRFGEPERAAHLLRVAETSADPSRTLQVQALRVHRAKLDFLQKGAKSAREAIANTLRNESPSRRFVGFPGLLGLEVAIDFATGQWDDAEARIVEADPPSHTHEGRSELLVVALAMEVLTGRAARYRELAEVDFRRAVYDGRSREATLLGCWLAAALASRDAKRAGGILAEASPGSGRPFLWTKLLEPTLGLAILLYAEGSGDRSVLPALAEMATVDERLPWYRANRMLAGGGALALSGKREQGVTLLQEAQALFEGLTAPLFADLAKRWSKDAGSASSGLIGRAGARAGSVRGRRSGRPGDAKHPLSKRELEVAELVAWGLANREIAKTLFVSERTIEAHLANVFGKLGISSRTQLTRWYVVQQRDATPG